MNIFQRNKLIILVLILIILYYYFIYKKENNIIILDMNNTNYDYIYEKYDTKYIENYHYPSSYIFEIFTKNNYKKIYDETIKIQKYFGINKTVYGIKKVNNEYIFEYYYYYPNENKLNTVTDIFKFFNIHNNINNNNINNNYYLVSFELDANMPHNLNDINIYYSLNNCNHNLNVYYHNIFSICQKCLTCMNKTYNIKTNTIIDKNIYKFFFRNNSTLEEIFNYTQILIGKDVDLNIICTPYLLSCKKSICISKKPKTIGFYFSLIPFDDFIIFLEKMNFDTKLSYTLINNKNKLSYLLFDIGFDIMIKEDNSIIFTKLSFYGIL